MMKGREAMSEDKVGDQSRPAKRKEARKARSPMSRGWVSGLEHESKPQGVWDLALVLAVKANRHKAV